MRSLKLVFIAFSFVAVATLPSAAQVVNTTAGPTYLAVAGPYPGFACNPSNVCLNPGVGIPLDNYATSSSVTNQFAVVNNQIATANNQITTANGQIATLNGQASTLSGQTATLSNQVSNLNGQVANLNSVTTNLNNQVRRDVSFAAAVGAMRDAIPNDGDRFAVRLNTAAVGNAVGAGFSMSANIDKQFRASVNYGTARGENVVSGGLNFSFN